MSSNNNDKNNNRLSAWDGDYAVVRLNGIGPITSARVMAAADGKLFLHPAPILGSISAISKSKPRIIFDSRCYFRQPYFGPIITGQIPSDKVITLDEWSMLIYTHSTLPMDELQRLMSLVGDAGVGMFRSGARTGRFDATVAPSEWIVVDGERIPRREWERRRIM